MSNVKEVLKSSVDQVSPNPFIDQTSFNMFVQNSEVKLKIFDATGQLILSKTSKYEAGEHQVIINGNSLPEGAYIYRVEIGDEETFSHRFTKIR
ncbi:MAG: T9SS type A sorting domain-containing protein [Saprospiraceae bacterium]|nr:T9SS type A sorting domain-containing protein [Saprospiraceae bacterium]